MPIANFWSTGAHNLWEVKGVAADGVEDQILQLVDGGEQVLAQGSHGNGGVQRSTATMAKRLLGKD